MCVYREGYCNRNPTLGDYYRILYLYNFIELVISHAMFGWKAALARDARGQSDEEDLMPSCPLIIAGTHVEIDAFMHHWKYHSLVDGVRLPLLAVVNEDGVLGPAKRLPVEDVFRPTRDAPVGGIPAAVVESALVQSPVPPETCLQMAMRVAALPTFVLLDFSRGDNIAELEAANWFSATTFGASCVVIGADCPTDSTAGWLRSRSLPLDASPTLVIEAALAAWTGRPLPLIPVSPHSLLTRCLVCGSEVRDAPALSCAGCLAVCFCDAACQMTEQTLEGGLPHGASCACLRQMRSSRDSLQVIVAKDESTVDTTWIDACMGGGGPPDVCSLLKYLGLHSPGSGYQALCGCGGAAPTAALQPLGLLTSNIARDRLPLTSWMDAYDVLGLPASSPISLLLCLPFTLLHALYRVGLLEATASSASATAQPARHTVYCLGASTECEGQLYSVYAVLAHLLPRGTHLHVIFMGPQLSIPSELSSAGKEAVWKCQETAVVVRVSFQIGLYHTIDTAALPPPTLTIAHNAGLGEYASWQPTLRALNEQKVPFCFTSYGLVEVDAAAAQLRAAGILPGDIHTEINPFRMPLDEARRVACGSVDFPWVPNAILTLVTVARLLPELEFNQSPSVPLKASASYCSPY